jgi:hypothetical protein
VCAGDEDSDIVTVPNTSSSGGTAAIATYSGVDPADPIDAVGTATADTGEPYVCGVTTTETTRIVVIMGIDGTSGVSEVNATFTGTGGITFDGRFYNTGDLVVFGSGDFAAGVKTGLGFNSDAAGNNTRNAILLAIALRPAGAAVQTPPKRRRAIFAPQRPPTVGAYS